MSLAARAEISAAVILGAAAIFCYSHGAIAGGEDAGGEGLGAGLTRAPAGLKSRAG
jgi:hypothetical protein